ncbi:MAG TPA: SEC-C metal-binding domain-containing protein [Thermoanaerobaculia bacterium]
MHPSRAHIEHWRTSCVRITRTSAFEPSSKRRRGYPSETRVKRGLRIVHGDKELLEKLGRNDPCPCGSGRRFQEVLHALRPL